METDRFAAGQRADFYHLLVEAITDHAIVMLNPAGLVMSWNAGAKQLMGYDAADVLGRYFSYFFTEEDREKGLPEHALAQAKQEKFESQVWRIRQDGSQFWAHSVIHPVRDAKADLIGFAELTRELGEQAPTQPRKPRADQFRFLVQGVTDYAIYLLSPEGEITSWNPGAERIKGYSPEEIIGQHFSRFYIDEERQKKIPQQALEIAAREGRYEREGWRLRKDGTRFWANVVIDPIRGEDGSILGFAKITRDITERRNAERALEQARESLFQSQKMEAVGQLTGGVAHDFNNLLMVILGSLELVRKRIPSDPKLVRLVENAIHGAQRGAALTQRMLAFARRQELKLVALDVAELVRGMIDLLQSSIGPLIQIETRFPYNLRNVQADPNQLELVILNLAVNARDAMPRGGPIVISAQELEPPPGVKPGNYVCLSIMDKGEGMDQATLTRALEPFFTTKGVGKGTGLGLSMAQGMIEQSGGKLILKSKKGEGTTVELWLPVASSLPDTDAAPEALAEQPALGRPLVVLAVDDDPLVLLNTVAMLEDLGHCVFQATSGQQALDIVRREKPIDLVITDQAMPNMAGTELARHIKDVRPDLPIILATGYAELPADADTTLPQLPKPFRQHELTEAIADAIRKAMSPRAAKHGRLTVVGGRE